MGARFISNVRVKTHRRDARYRKRSASGIRVFVLTNKRWELNKQRSASGIPVFVLTNFNKQKRSGSFKNAIGQLTRLTLCKPHMYLDFLACALAIERKHELHVFEDPNHFEDPIAMKFLFMLV